jgi:hypothetical protein
MSSCEKSTAKAKCHMRHKQVVAGPILLNCSFPYVRERLNNHPFRNSPEARLIFNLHNGSPIRPEVPDNMMNQREIAHMRRQRYGNRRNCLLLLNMNRTHEIS